MSISAFTRRPRRFEDVLIDVGGRPPIAAHSNQRNFTWYSKSSERKLALLQSLGQISKREFGHELTLPALPIAPATVAAGHEGAPLEALSRRMEEFDAQLMSSIQQCPYFGRVEYAGDRDCIFKYFDASTHRGLLETVHNITGHEHHLVQVRERKLTDSDVRLPPKQQRILRALPRSVYPQVRIITGMLILVKQQDEQTVRRPTVIKTTGLKVGAAVEKTGREVGAAIRRYAPGAVGGVAGGALAAGAVLAVGALVSAITAPVALGTAAAATVAVVAASDPALVLGDLVISGWIDEE